MRFLLLVLIVLSAQFAAKGHSSRYYPVNDSKLREIRAEMHSLRDLYIEILRHQIESSMENEEMGDDLEPKIVKKKPGMESNLRKKSGFPEIEQNDFEDDDDDEDDDAPVFSNDWFGLANLPIRRRHYVSKK